jgi:hypothetical protein
VANDEPGEKTREECLTALADFLLAKAQEPSGSEYRYSAA